eukprot:gene28092-31200_t
MSPKSDRWLKRGGLLTYLLGAALLSWAIASWLVVSGILPEGVVPSLVGPTDMGQPSHLGDRKILVMYIFAATDPEFLDNLRFFISEAVEQDTLCEYVIVVQRYRDEEQSAEVDLPLLPPHAKYVFHENECYDWGTFGWLLRSGHVDIRKYLYFIFMNCSVRGPFYPSYARGHVHWTHPFLRRLRGDVKLVGPTISCEGSPLDGAMSDPSKWRWNPHVQSYVVATDRCVAQVGFQVSEEGQACVPVPQQQTGAEGTRCPVPPWVAQLGLQVSEEGQACVPVPQQQVGLQVLKRDKHVFQCHSNRWNTIYHSELGSSAAMFRAGYNIDCLMERYQDVDWRDPTNWVCNARFSPQGENFLDGITLDPLEVMFVKVKSFTLMNAISYGVRAVKYGVWQSRDNKPNQLSKGQRLIGSFFKPATSADQQRERSAAEARKTAELVMKRTKPEMMVPRNYIGTINNSGLADTVNSNEYLANTARFKISALLSAPLARPCGMIPRRHARSVP